MAGDALARVAAVEGVVTQFVTVAMAGRAGALRGKNFHPKPILDHQDELSWWDAETEGGNETNQTNQTIQTMQSADNADNSENENNTDNLEN